MDTGRVEEQICFSLYPPRSLVYVILLDEGTREPAVTLEGYAIVARLPRERALAWANSDEVALSSSMKIDESRLLTLLVEKDFACLDLSDEENADTYPNPNAGLGC